MKNKKSGKGVAVKPLKNNRYNGILIVSLIILVILAILILKNPAITGKAIFSKENIHSENLNLRVNESGVYEWQVKNPGTIKSLKVTGAVSSNGTARVYIEKNGTKTLLFDSTKQLFDVDIHVLPEYKKIMQGEKILIQNILFNLRGFGSGNVNVKYSIKDNKGNIIATQEESVYVETQAKFIRELVIPEEIKSGSYVAFVEATSNGTIVGTGSDSFEVASKSEEPFYRQLKYYIIGLVAAFAFVILLLFGVQRYNALKKKKKIVELEKKAPLEKVEKLESELKALESAYNGGFISKESYEKDRKRIEEKLGVSKNADGTGEKDN